MFEYWIWVMKAKKRKTKNYWILDFAIYFLGKACTRKSLWIIKLYFTTFCPLKTKWKNIVYLCKTLSLSISLFKSQYFFIRVWCDWQMFAGFRNGIGILLANWNIHSPFVFSFQHPCVTNKCFFFFIFHIFCQNWYFGKKK